MNEHDSSETTVGPAREHHAPVGSSRPFCTVCGRPVDPDAQFCSSCGKGVSRPAPPAAEQLEAASPPVDHQQPEHLCPEPKVPLPAFKEESAPVAKPCSCGRSLVPNAAFCPWCGLRSGDTVPRFCLVGRTAGIKGKRYAITEQGQTIGQGLDCEISVGCDGFASGRHARVSHSKGMVFLEDLASTNGTFLRIGRSVALEVGDEIAVGRSVFRLEEDRGQKQPPEVEACQISRK